MPTIRFSISCPSHLLAEADIGRADYEKSDHDTDVNEIRHNYVLLLFVAKTCHRAEVQHNKKACSGR